ncbi:acyltransferase family protein [Glaciecola sp. 1036]|uniref:acyltransferase family protein n=1 Tax=Alteromonadaceae TaxID=72275 RepID=UPI003CFF91C5
MTIVERRDDIDWLRVLAFFILIGYHIGMFYVLDWGWHIKSEHQSQILQDIMILFNQWRMSLLFFISAMSLALFQQKYGLKNVLSIRSKRLLIPLVFGMLVIVPPQLYIELQHSIGYDKNYLSFLSEYYNLDTQLAPEKQSVIGLITWNHLWFLPYLFVYSVILLLIHKAITRLVESSFIQKLSLPVFVALLVVTTTLIWLALRQKFPTTHDLVNDWYSHAKYFWVFLVGYGLVYTPKLWDSVVHHRWRLLMVAVVCYAFIIADRHGAWTFLADRFETSLLVKSFYGSVFTLNHWTWILALVGLAGHYLRFTNQFLRYANTAILPWYMLHQTLIIIVANYLAPNRLPVVIELSLITAITLVGCFVGYELAKRIKLLRLLFGLKH